MQQILAMQKQQGEMLIMQRQQAEEHCLLRDELHWQSEINVALEAKVAAKSGTSDSDTVAKSAEQLLERRTKLTYVPEASVNPFPQRPATLTTRMPQLYDLHGNKTYDALSKKSNSSMKYECLVLAPSLSYLHDVVRQRRGAWRAAGAGSEEMQWITHGVKLRWKCGPPPPFDHGVSLKDATHQQQVWLDAKKESLLENGAWTRATRRSHGSRAFLVPKPGMNKWKLVVGFRWLNQWCVKNRVKMEMLKKLRRLAKPGDWCFSFDLQDSFHALGIHPDVQ
ncbi:hypothetical protein CYMTET_24194 [Cymbomonas tetramitiformis]|uniref:Uncharacterized protein n=1 Tax=Cymbomonas tetramitiformis TaxID=36881 RepID=A0AAE0FWD3_9CHLO|nr:hypothetical protein CYMTET_24194 [Cymbomonas tetramitiformis]